MADALSITWLGHSTVLLEADGTRLLTDPLLVPHIGPVRRVVPEPEPLTPVDAVLVSHVHYDHLDVPSLRLVPSPLIVVPAGAGRLLRRRSFSGIAELEAGDETTIGALTVRATPAEHKARRGLFSPEILALGFLVSGPSRVYFPGDTDLFEGMSGFAPGLDVALLPVAGWGPRVGAGHLDPARAAEALRHLRPRVAIPIHWGTYRRMGLPRDPKTLREPAELFARLAAEQTPEVTVRILDPGESATIPLPAESRAR
jgi:L-ascorbate metabolism protein UlaG (beta-lactamase superfamily)